MGYYNVTGYGYVDDFKICFLRSAFNDYMLRRDYVVVKTRNSDNRYVIFGSGFDGLLQDRFRARVCIYYDSQFVIPPVKSA